ncbi:MAG: hypothetical protein NUV32_09360 [Exilispira sp.]|jgi:hypothetical protein|nr:hypothetical protein [Exilispira sp.]
MEKETKIISYYKKYEIFISLSSINLLLLFAFLIISNIIYFIINLNRSEYGIDKIIDILSDSNHNLIAIFLSAIILFLYLIFIKAKEKDLSIIRDLTIDKNSIYYKKISSKSLYYNVIIFAIITLILIYFIVPRILIFIIFKK